MKSNSLQRLTGGLLILEGLLIFVPTIILGAAINWPQSLDQPASVNLPLILAQSGAVNAGYFAYLIYSILFFVVILLLARMVAGGETFNSVLKAAVGLAALSALARSIGIVRWLSAMPILARLYTEGSPETQATVAVVYDAINAYGGTIGEALGVGLFAGLAMFALVIAMWRTPTMPKWLTLFALIAAVAVTLQTLALFGVDMGALITVLVAVLQFWFLAAGAYFVRGSLLAEAK